MLSHLDDMNGHGYHQVVLESSTSSTSETETVIVAMYGEGEIFGLGGFCLSLPETSHIAQSDKVST